MKLYIPPALLLFGLFISLYFFRPSEDGSGSLLSVAICVAAAVVALVMSLVNKQSLWLLVSALMLVLLPVISVYISSSLL